MADERELLSSLVQELRRGTIILGVLSQLARPTYGYHLVQQLSAKGIPMEANTLYPLLRRLEKQGLLRSEWETSGAKPRKYYQRTSLGDQIYTGLQDQWRNMIQNMQDLMRED